MKIITIISKEFAMINWWRLLALILLGFIGMVMWEVTPRGYSLARTTMLRGGYIVVKAKFDDNQIWQTMTAKHEAYHVYHMLSLGEERFTKLVSTPEGQLIVEASAFCFSGMDSEQAIRTLASLYENLSSFSESEIRDFYNSLCK